MIPLSKHLLLLFVFAVSWEDLIVIPGLGTVSRLFGGAAAVLGCAAVLNKGRVVHVPFYSFALGFVALAWLGALWSVDADTTLQRAFTYTQLLIVCWLIFQFSEAAFIESLLKAYVLGGFVSIIATFHAYLQGVEVAYQRYSAEGFDPNDLSFYLNLAIPLAGYLASRVRGWERYLYISYLPLSVIAVLLTASRGGALGAAVGLLFASLSLWRISSRMKVFLMATVAIGVGLSAQLIPIETFTRLATISDEISTGTLSDRTLIWQCGFESFLLSPILGTGSGTFSLAVSACLGAGSAPHNVFVAILVEGGLLALLFWIGMLLASGGAIFQVEGENRLLLLGLWGVLILAFLSLNFEWRKVTWIFLTLSAIILRTRRLYN